MLALVLGAPYGCDCGRPCEQTAAGWAKHLRPMSAVPHEFDREEQWRTKARAYRGLLLHVLEVFVVPRTGGTLPPWLHDAMDEIDSRGDSTSKTLIAEG